MRISDWSSDVCSSDLADPPGHVLRNIGGVPGEGIGAVGDDAAVRQVRKADAERHRRPTVDRGEQHQCDTPGDQQQIGRASCRERVCKYVYISVVAVALNKHELTK